MPTVLGLARRYPQAGIPVDADQLSRFYTFTDFAHFIDVYQVVNRLVRSQEDVTALVVGAARDAAASNVRWAELTVTASTHLRAGFDPAALKEALETGRAIACREHGVRLGYIIDIPAEFGLDAADATVGFLRDHAPAGTLAIGLAGLEQSAPRVMFARHVEQARDLGYRAAVQAGESTGPATIWSALRDLKADRIGHGISAVADPYTDLDREYEYVAGLAGLGPEGLAQIARAGARASFAPDEVKRELIGGINDTLAGAYARA